jgi:hypothetical protein
MRMPGCGIVSGVLAAAMQCSLSLRSTPVGNRAARWQLHCDAPGERQVGKGSFLTSTAVGWGRLPRQAVQ